MKKEARENNAPVHLNNHKKTGENWRDEDVLVFPASVIQQQFWVLNQLYPDSPAYNIPYMFRIKGRLNTSALERSLNEVIRRHDVFRTTFTTRKGELLQVITRQLHIDLPIMDLSSRKKSELDVEVQQIVRTEAALPFDLSRGPLIRARLLWLSDREHIFIIAMHHTICDLHTSEQFAVEFSTLFNAYTAGKPASLANPAWQYSDYAVWQKDWLKSEEFSSMLSYWKQQLQGKGDFLDLPADRQRPAIQSLNGTAYPVKFSPSFTNEIKQFSRKEKVITFLTLLSAYAILLHRYSGQNDIVVGVPYTNRRRDEHKDIMGCFVNILPLSVDLSDDPSFRQVKQRLREAMLGAHRHQEVPYELIVQELQKKREGSHNPLFQVGFTFAPPMKLELQGLTVESISIHPGGSQLDVFPTFWDSEQGICGHFEYNTDLFDETTIERFAGSYLTLLKAIMEDADQPVSLLPILTEPERKQLLVAWNDTRVDYPQDKLIHQIFEAQAGKKPDDIALVFEGEQLTYGELNQRANQLAHYLKSIGVGPETLVGIAVERSLEMVVGLYGILKAGGAYVPLDPSYPEERLAQMIEDASVPVILTQARLRDSLPANEAQVVCLDADWNDLIAGRSTENPVCEATLDNLAYTIYTSGSTGKPKGVMNTHRGILNRLLWMQDAYQLTASDSVLQKTPFSFDVSVWEFFWPLMFGARLVVARPEGHKDSDYLVKTIIENQITTIHFVPSMLQIFLMARDVEKCTSLRQVICSGEALPYDLQNRFFARLNAKLHNLYGPTEAAVDVTYWECQRENDLNTVPIGRPVANTQIYILDRCMQPVPVGVSGELYIGGVQVARGYLNRPELTAEKFIPDPFSDNPEAHLYKTGDLARFLPDGNVEYLGRLDFQVKIRGNRIELGEIEALLSNHPGVRDVCVLAREDVPGDQRLVAYLIPAQNQTPATGELRQYVKQKLPEFMVPSHFVTLDAFPLTPNQKVDRKALPVPDEIQVKPETTYVPPRNDLQQTIANIWQEVLNIPRVGMNDNFFELGGHSLLIVQVYYRLCEITDKELSITDMFMFPTISTLTEYLSQDSGNGNEIAVQRITERAKTRRAAIIRRRQVRQNVI